MAELFWYHWRGGMAGGGWVEAPDAADGAEYPYPPSAQEGAETGLP